MRSIEIRCSCVHVCNVCVRVKVKVLFLVSFYCCCYCYCCLAVCHHITYDHLFFPHISIIWCSHIQHELCIVGGSVNADDDDGDNDDSEDAKNRPAKFFATRIESHTFILFSCKNSGFWDEKRPKITEEFNFNRFIWDSWIE